MDRILAILRNEDGAAGAAVAETVVERVQLQSKEFEAKAPLWVSTGGDPTRIRVLAEQLDVHLKAGAPDKAEPILDQLLALVSAAPAANRATTAPASTTPKTVRLARIPDSARIVYHHHQLIYVMDATGGNITQITFDKGRNLEHVAVSPDGKRVVGSYFANPGQGGQSSQLVLFDLEAGTERAVVPHFRMAGNGGVDWDAAGNIYFAGVERAPFDQPNARAQFIANAAANDVYRVKYDGTGLKRLTDTLDRGEAWVNSSDSTAPRLVYKGGKGGVASVHDPEISPDGSGLTRVTKPGPIAIVPDWVGDQVLFLLLTDQERPSFKGIAVVNSDGTGLRKINSHANIAKWIPDTP
ncbi:MAG: hypothetical protein ABIS29_08575 [Vicinamibacterales bacterium]